MSAGSPPTRPKRCAGALAVLALVAKLAAGDMEAWPKDPMEWLRAHGGSARGVRVATESTLHGGGLVATEDLEAGELPSRPSPSLPRSPAPLPPISQSPFLPPSLPPPSPGALVLTVPRECMLMAGEGAHDEEAAAAEALHEGCRLSLRLLDERALGAASPLHGWISSLPPRVETPVHWQDAQLRRLGCPLLIAQVPGSTPTQTRTEPEPEPEPESRAQP